MVEVVEGEVIWEGVVDRWPILAASWLYGQPPLKYSWTKLIDVNFVAARVLPAPFHERGDLGGPVAGWEGKASRLT